MNTFVISEDDLGAGAALPGLTPTVQYTAPAAGRGDREHLGSRRVRHSTENSGEEARTTQPQTQHNLSTRGTSAARHKTLCILCKVILDHALRILWPTSIHTKNLTNKSGLGTSGKWTAKFGSSDMVHLPGGLLQ